MNDAVTRHEDTWHGLSRRLHDNQCSSSVARESDSIFVRGQDVSLYSRIVD